MLPVKKPIVNNFRKSPLETLRKFEGGRLDFGMKYYDWV
jgi:hypothetical protein